MTSARFKREPKTSGKFTIDHFRTPRFAKSGHDKTFANRKKGGIIAVRIERWWITMEHEFGRRAKAVQHKGVEIFVTDYSGLKGTEMIETMKENAKIIVPRVQGRKDCLMVNIFKNCQLDEYSLKYISRIQKAMEGTFVASALVGMTAMQRTGIEIGNVLKKSSFTTKFFDDEKEAMDWASDVYKKVVSQHNSRKR
jgi:hypothetical protein